MKSPLTPANETPTQAQRTDFFQCLLINGLIAAAFSLVVDLVYFLIVHAGAVPGAGWVMQSLHNLLFGFSLAFVALMVWRRGGAWPFLPYKKSIRNLINGLFLGAVLALLVIALVYSLLAACEGNQVVEAFRQLGNTLLAQGEEAAYVGVKLIVVSAGVELTGKTESDPPR